MSPVYVVCWIFLQTFQTYFCIQANLGPHCLQKWLLKLQADDKADDNSCDWCFKGKYLLQPRHSITYVTFFNVHDISQFTVNVSPLELYVNPSLYICIVHIWVHHIFLLQILDTLIITSVSKNEICMTHIWLDLLDTCLTGLAWHILLIFNPPPPPPTPPPL